MTIELVTNPAYEPVSLAEARRWLRLEADDTDNTPVLQILIKAMREYAENLTFRAFVSRQLRLYIEDWPADTKYGAKIVLPFPPLISVDSFKYRDTDGVLQTLATTEYAVHDWSEPAIIIPAWGETWPTIRRVPDAIQVTFTCGYAPGSPSDEAANQEVQPAALRLWLQARLATLFENREQLIAGNQVEIPRAFADGLLDGLVVGTRLF